MLTESEREWLNEREIILECEGCYIWAGYWEEGVELEVMQEAAEFSERVAAKLAEAYGTMMDYNGKHSLCQTCRFEVVKTLGCMSTCAETALRWAQLAAEEEMDNEP